MTLTWSFDLSMAFDFCFAATCTQPQDRRLILDGPDVIIGKEGVPAMIAVANVTEKDRYQTRYRTYNSAWLIRGNSLRKRLTEPSTTSELFLEIFDPKVAQSGLLAMFVLDDDKSGQGAGHGSPFGGFRISRLNITEGDGKSDEMTCLMLCQSH